MYLLQLQILTHYQIKEKKIVLWDENYLLPTYIKYEDSRLIT